MGLLEHEDEEQLRARSARTARQKLSVAAASAAGQGSSGQPERGHVDALGRVEALPVKGRRLAAGQAALPTAAQNGGPPFDLLLRQRSMKGAEERRVSAAAR
jgi:hypothetical protein